MMPRDTDHPETAAPLIYLVAGEQSGDALGGRLIQALRRVRPELRFAGLGGPRMAEAGVDSLFPIRELALMGLLEVLPNLRRLSRRLNETIADIDARKPAVVVTIDSPGFSLRVLKRLKGAGVPRVHYVAPQVWAWRQGRVRNFPGLWERLLCLLPFEPAFFAKHGLPASFVGHPVLESGADHGDGAAFRARHGLAEDAKVLILMPGSRPSEVRRLLPVFAETLTRLASRHPGLVTVVPIASAVAETVRGAVAAWAPAPIIVTEPADKYDAFAAASAALTKSGTSTLELAMANVPMAVTYRVNWLTARIARQLIQVRFASIVNLLLGREVIPELIQQDSTPKKLAATVDRLLTQPAVAAAQRAGFAEALGSLRPGDASPSEAAAAAILACLTSAGTAARTA